ncbi:hypothetical protein [Novosphingobium sp. MD-1]|uniref:hypothetical protein n=1 Tax=Novosphingobium sp. MD-1 TaxID=1630648 RepID=UPI00061CBD91|nr:hypothetical protein [Novosphingobium sp. MD-1]GAO52974.1 hypothetical protein NMD1_02631 [Novosphingobium sp. MD-1]
MPDDGQEVLPDPGDRMGNGPWHRRRPRRLASEDDEVEIVTVRYARARGPGRSDPRGYADAWDDDLAPPRMPRRRSSAFARGRGSSARGPVLLLLALALAVLAWWWWQDSHREYRTFPPSGSVTVTTALRPGAATARLGIRAGSAKAIVQLLAPQSGAHVLSIFLRAGDRRIVPVPPGAWRVRVIEGHAWDGPRRLFGPQTHIRRLPGLLRLAPGQHQALSLGSRESGS